MSMKIHLGIHLEKKVEIKKKSLCKAADGQSRQPNGQTRARECLTLKIVEIFKEKS